MAYHKHSIYQIFPKYLGTSKSLDASHGKFNPSMLSLGWIKSSSQLATRELLPDPVQDSNKEEEEEEEEEALGELREWGDMTGAPIYLFSFLCDEKASSLFTTIPFMP